MTTREEAIAFRERAKLLAESEAGYKIYAGDIWEAKTVRGNSNYVISLRIYEDYMFYGHGDKVKKVKIEEFLRAVESGDLQLRYIDEVDVERLSMCQIALDAIANRRTFEEAVDMQLEEAERIFGGNYGIADQV